MAVTSLRRVRNMAARRKRSRYVILFYYFALAATIYSIFIRFSRMSENDKIHTENGHTQGTLPVPSGSSLFTVLEKRNTKPQLSDEITLVTAYWNLGRFRKGSGSTFFDTKLYYRWTNIFKYIMNPLVVYTDASEFANLMRFLRNTTLHRTQIYLVDRNTSWAFRNVKRIGEVYSQPNYPKHYPNTVLPEYACAQHAKYDVIVRAASENIYRTHYFAWIDVGYFRNRRSTERFRLIKPKDFNESLVAMNEVVARNKKLSTERIFKGNVVWVGGGLVLGRYDVVIRFGGQFQRALDYFLSKGLMNTDQQILYGMYTDEGKANINADINIQNYIAKGDWFFLGNRMVEEIKP